MPNYEEMNRSELQRLTNQGDNEAEYYLAMSYLNDGDYGSVINGLKKIIANNSHPRRIKATGFLAQLYAANGSPFMDKKEAKRLLESIKDEPNAVISRLNLGFLYCEESRIDEGLNLIEKAVKLIISTDGNDDYLKQVECYKIGVAYEGAQCFEASTKYYKKAIDRGDQRYESDQIMIRNANEAIESNERRKSILEDVGKYRPNIL